MVHQRVGGRKRRRLNPLNAVRRSSCFDGGVAHHACRGDRALLGARVEGEDDRVTGLQRDERLEDRRRGGVCHRGDTADHADRLSNLGDAGELVAGDDPDGAKLRHRVGHVLTREDVLHCLVFEDAASSLLDRELGEVAVLVQGGDGGLGNDVVDLLLVEGGVLLQSDLRLRHQVINVRLGGVSLRGRGVEGFLDDFLGVNLVVCCGGHALLLTSVNGCQ